MLARGSGESGTKSCPVLPLRRHLEPNLGRPFVVVVVVVVVLVVVVLSGVWFAGSSPAFGHAGPSPAALLLLAATAACVVVVVVVVVVAAVVLVLCPCPCQALVIVGKYDIKSFFEAWNLEG